MSDLHLGDCMDIMAGMDANSLDALVTDPPAGIAFMGKAWDNHNRYEPRSYRAQETYSMLVGVLDMEPWEAGFVAFTIDWALEALRVLKPGAHGLVWALPRTSDLTGIGLRAAGFEIRDNVYHIFATGYPKSFDIGKGIDAKHGATRKVVATVKKTPSAASENMNDGWRRPWAEDHPKTMDITEPATDDARAWDGWGTALKPAAEEWILIRKPFAGNVVDNVLEWGTGAINIDACRVPITDGAILGRNNKPGANGWKNSSGGPTNAILYGEPNGRWPANVVTDGSDEVVSMFPETLPGKRANRGSNTVFAPEGTVRDYDDNGGSAARFFYIAKAGKKDKEEGLDNFHPKVIGHNLSTNACATCGKRIKANGSGDKCECGDERVTMKNESSTRNPHPTVKATELMRWLVRLVTPSDGIVLDPFMGSGSTGKACAIEGFNFVGIERDQEYFEIAQARIEAAQLPILQECQALPTF